MPRATPVRARILLVNATKASRSLVERAMADLNMELQVAADAGAMKPSDDAWDLIILHQRKSLDTLPRQVRTLRAIEPLAMIIVVVPGSALAAAETAVGDQVTGCIASNKFDEAVIRMVARAAAGQHGLTPAFEAKGPGNNGAIRAIGVDIRRLRHDLRTSVGIIWMHLEILRRHAAQANPAVADSIREIHDSTCDMVRVVDEIGAKRPTP